MLYTMRYFNTVLETIGNTPLIRINTLTAAIPALVLAKVETTNPGNSVKDRMALKMIEDAEKKGWIKKGGTVIEGTSGNTGMGLALACIVKGYQLVCVLNDKQSREKIDILKAVGAEVVVCPTNVAPDDPRSYYSVAKRMAKEIPNAWYVNQYDNASNARAHYEQTGPEIWRQTEGKITHFVVGVGTGGTISGTGSYLKEQNPNIQLLGIDTYGSVFKKYHETGIFDESEIYPYITEGIGEDMLPGNVDFSIIDHFEKVTDKDAAIYARKLARKEGIFVGNSAGAAIAGVLQMKERFRPDDVVVVLFHDHGSRYVGKIFNDDWMRERGFLEKEFKNAGDILLQQRTKKLISCTAEEPVSVAVHQMNTHNVSQIPVAEKGRWIGYVDETRLYQQIITDKTVVDKPLKEVVQPPLPVIGVDTRIDEISQRITKEVPAVLVDGGEKGYHIISRYDLMHAIV